MDMAVTGTFKFLSSPSVLLGETRDSKLQALLPHSVETFKKDSAECPVGMKHTLGQWEHVRSNSLQGFFLGQ